MGNFFKHEFVDTWKGFTKEKIKPTTLLLVVMNIVCLLVSNIIAVKTLSLGLEFGSGAKFVQFTVPAAVLMYVFSVICSSILAQVDWVWTRRSCHLGFILNLLMVGMFTATIYVPGTIGGGAENGMGSNIGIVLGSSWFMLIASLLSFYLGDLLNDNVFARLRSKDGDDNGKLVKRFLISTLCGQLVDSGIFITFGLFLLPKWFSSEHTPFIGFDWATMSYGLWGGWASVLGTIALQLIVKLAIKFILSPLIVKICNYVDKMNKKEEIVTIE